MNAVVGDTRKRSETDRRSPSSDVPKRLKTTHEDGETPRTTTPRSYTVGWICALPIELSSAKAMLDNVHDNLVISADDSNTYILGDMAGHNVVMACLPARQYGNNNAATVANNMHRSFPSIRLRLMVGIGGGVPGKADIRLGDVVVSDLVVQYDIGKTVQHGKFERTGTSVKPPQALLTAVSKLEASHASEPSKISTILTGMIQKHPIMTDYTHRDILQDQLFDSAYDHIDPMGKCDLCSASRMIQRPPRANMNPKIHYGVIASGNQVMRHGETRDKLAQELGALCFEMEAAGLMDHFQCLVVRGICDYSDSHKNKEWQKYASATAAAYARELLSIIPPDGTRRTPQRNAARHKRLLESLSFDYIDSRRSTVESQHSNTCEWLLSHPDYLDWSNPAKAGEHHGFLWIKGKPGAGKSTILKFACRQASEDKSHTVVSFFFNARGGDLERSVVGMYRALLFQLLKAVPSLLEIFDNSIHQDKLDNLWADVKHQKRHAQWDVQVLRSLLRDAVAKLGHGRLTCFIDALDECAEDEVETMIEYFEDLGAYAVSRKTRLRICFSSRHYPHINIQHGLKLVLELQKGHEKDIATYIQQKLKVGSNKTSDEVRSKMEKKADGIFMWVVLVVGILNEEYKSGRIFAVKKRLDTIPTRLNGLFKEVLSRDQRNLQDMKLSIQWILFARRPLQLEEYYFAVVSGLNPEELGEWDREELNRDDMYRFLLSSSKGLAEVTKGTTQTVQFIHESVREFFIKDGLKELWPDLEYFECMSHDQLKACCYTWIQLDVWAHIPSGTQLPRTFSDVKNNTPHPLSDRFPFLNYAFYHVFYHANAAGKEISQQGFLEVFDLRAWVRLNHFFTVFWDSFVTPDKYLELSDSMTTDSGAEVLSWLAESGYTEVVKAILSVKDVDINSRDWRGNAPLSLAAGNGHQDTVRVLLAGEGINLQPRNDWGYTPLSLAAEQGRESVVKLLLESGGVDVNLGSHLGHTPLFRAASGDCCGTVKLLLEAEGIQINLRDNLGMTALMHAAMLGHYKTVKLLLGAEGIQVNSKDNGGKTALAYATAIRHRRTIKLLS